MQTEQSSSGNGCDVSEQPWSKVATLCKCDFDGSDDFSDCQLEFPGERIQCNENASNSCRSAVERWALAYKNAPNANDPICKYKDPNYKGSLIAMNSCKSGGFKL